MIDLNNNYKLQTILMDITQQCHFNGMDKFLLINVTLKIGPSKKLHTNILVQFVPF